MFSVAMVQLYLLRPALQMHQVWAAVAGDLQPHQGPLSAHLTRCRALG
jgi:hypothetical protein